MAHLKLQTEYIRFKKLSMLQARQQTQMKLKLVCVPQMVTSLCREGTGRDLEDLLLREPLMFLGGIILEIVQT